MEVKNINFGYGKNNIIKDVSLNIKEKKITTIIGANGCGKSTLFNVLSKNLKIQKGSIHYQNRDIYKIRANDFAKHIAIVHQYNTAPQDITVEKLVAYGRIPYKKIAFHKKDEDERLVQWALEITGTKELKHKKFAHLSGGQKQRVWIAMALAQNPKLLFLDEPTTYLDLKYQYEILGLIKKLNREQGITVVMVLHDINQAIQFSDVIIGMKDGRILFNGEHNAVINNRNLFDVYGANFEVVRLKDNLMFVKFVAGD